MLIDKEEEATFSKRVMSYMREVLCHTFEKVGHVFASERLTWMGRVVHVKESCHT